MTPYEGDTRWETRQQGRNYVVSTRATNGIGLELTVTSSDDRGQSYTELSGRIPVAELDVVVRLLVGALALACNGSRNPRYVREFEDWSAFTADYRGPADGEEPVRAFASPGFEPWPGPWSVTLEERRKQHPNAYKPWLAEDDERLRRRHAEGASVDDLVTEFGRGRGAILGRLAKVVLDAGSQNAGGGAA